MPQWTVGRNFFVDEMNAPRTTASIWQSTYLFWKCQYCKLVSELLHGLRSWPGAATGVKSGLTVIQP